MALLQWSPELAVGVDSMDATHQEFIELLGAAAGASQTELAERFDALLAHTREHFAAEEALMQQYGFFAIAEHTGEHRRVLSEMEAMRRQLDRGIHAMARAYLAEKVPEWFLLHRNTMDMAAAAFLRARGV